MTTALNPHYRFETLVVGAANRLAATAARAVAESPGAVYNPLFVYARPGLGKTHLLMGIGHAARAINAPLVVEYLTLDEFVEAFHAAIAAGQGEAYRKRFLELDLLLLDDVQFLTHRREMQAELLRLIDALQTAGKQIVLTSDRPPADIEALDERLIRRFGGGLVIDVAGPDYETRVAILRRKADERRVSFAPGVLEAVASLEIDNVRELLGALNRLIAFQAVSETPLDAERAKEVAGGGQTPTQGPLRGAAGDEAIGSPMGHPIASSPAAPRNDAVSEFDDFLSEISVTVAQQVESWRAKVAAAILRWEGEGYRTARLEALLSEEVPADPDASLRDYEADVERLRVMEAEAAELGGDVAGAAVFRDPGDLAGAEALLQRARDGANPPPAPSPLWRLEEFAEGSASRMAVRAAHAIVEEPGAKYNPLVIVGVSGTGKTHLLHGLGNALAQRADGPVACLGAHEFTGELIEAIDRELVPAWRARYRRAGALLLDDIHLVAEKDRTQEELFLLFNLLFEQGRQMVFTSAMPLAELSGVEPRLLTRLEGGLVVELPAPDREIRLQVVERMLGAKVGSVDPELAAYIAARPAESVRAAQGLVQRILNAAEAQQTTPTPALAREVLEGPPARQPKRSTPVRSSGVVGPTAGGIRSREKMVWDWPDPTDRLHEEWR